MRKLFSSTLLLIVFHTCYAQNELVCKNHFFNNSSVGIDLSTTGIGVSGIKTINKHFDVRLMGSVVNYSYDLNKLSPDLQGKASARIGNVGILADFYFLQFAHLSAGISHNLTKISLQGQMANSIAIGDILIPPDQIGTIEVTMIPGLFFNPYLGGGLNFRRNKIFRIGIEGGCFFIGKPNIELTATGMLEPTASQEQEKQMESNISPLIYYPYFALKLSYRIQFKNGHEK